MAHRPSLQEFFERQEAKRESRYVPNSGRWMVVAGLYGFTALIGLAFAITIISRSGHQTLPWWIPLIWTIGFGLASVGALRRMKRDRTRETGPGAQV